jgi:hypothetical protein
MITVPELSFRSVQHNERQFRILRKRKEQPRGFVVGVEAFHKFTMQNRSFRGNLYGNTILYAHYLNYMLLKTENIGNIIWIKRTFGFALKEF